MNFLGTAFDDVVNGNASANVLAGGGGNDTLSGLANNDTLFGQAGNDTLMGGGGNDILIGGIGVDRMLFGVGEIGLANQDTINNYIGMGAGRDLIDLSALLDATFSNGNNIANFVQLTDTLAGSLVQIDANGTANFTDVGNVATLPGVTMGSIVALYSRARSIRTPWAFDLTSSVLPFSGSLLSKAPGGRARPTPALAGQR